MSDYIKREDVMRILDQIHEVDTYQEMVEALPAADVVERKVGRWVMSKDGDDAVWNSSPIAEIFPIWACSVCGGGKEMGGRHRNYCPNCGAKMEENT